MCAQAQSCLMVVYGNPNKTQRESAREGNMTTQVEQVMTRKESTVRVGMLRRILGPFQKAVKGMHEVISFRAENIFKSKEWPYY